MNWDHQTVSVNLTTQTKVNFELWTKWIIWFSLIVLDSNKNNSLCGRGFGGRRFCRWKLDNSKIIWYFNYIPSHHLVLWWTRITRWWMLILQHIGRLNLNLLKGTIILIVVICFLKWKGRQLSWVGTGRWGERIMIVSKSGWCQNN